MILDIKIDIGEIAAWFNQEDGTFSEVVRKEIVSEVVRLVFSRVSIQGVKEQAEKEFQQKIDNHVQSLADHTKWWTEELTADAIHKKLIRLMMPDMASKIVKELKNDPSFIKQVAQETWSK